MDVSSVDCEIRKAIILLCVFIMHFQNKCMRVCILFDVFEP